jgi:hypothetical protein
MDHFSLPGLQRLRAPGELENQRGEGAPGQLDRSARWFARTGARLLWEFLRQLKGVPKAFCKKNKTKKAAL